MRLCRFLTRESREKRVRKTRRKTTMDRVFEKNFSCHFSLCNLDGSDKVLKLFCGVWKEVIFKKQKIVQTTQSHIL